MVGNLRAPALDGTVMLTADMPVRGIATSGAATKGSGGRSLSLGIADAVTVLAESAAAADAAATIIANEVDLPGHPAIRRVPASEIDPDSDLGDRPVTLNVGRLFESELRAALQAGAAKAETLRQAGLIFGAVLLLRGHQQDLQQRHPPAARRLGVVHAESRRSANSPPSSRKCFHEGGPPAAKPFRQGACLAVIRQSLRRPLRAPTSSPS